MSDSLRTYCAVNHQICQMRNERRYRVDNLTSLSPSPDFGCVRAKNAGIDWKNPRIPA